MLSRSTSQVAAQWERIHLPKGVMRETRLDSWVEKVLWRRKWQPTAVLLPEKPQGQRSLAGYSPWGRKESDTIGQLSITHTQ